MDLFEEYRNIDKYTLYDAGFLLCEQLPLPPYSDRKPESDRKKLIRNDARKKTLELLEAARKGHLRLVDKLNEAIKFNTDGITDDENKIINSGRGFYSDHKSNIWFVIRSDFKEWAIAMEINPTFLFGQKTPPINKTVTLRTSQVDKAKFQAIAKVMWADNPNLTQAAIINSEEMEFFKMTYIGKNTLPGWLREIDPRPKNSRRGCPKKYPST